MREFEARKWALAGQATRPLGRIPPWLLANAVSAARRGGAAFVGTSNGAVGGQRADASVGSVVDRGLQRHLIRARFARSYGSECRGAHQEALAGRSGGERGGSSNEVE